MAVNGLLASARARGANEGAPVIAYMRGVDDASGKGEKCHPQSRDQMSSLVCANRL